MAIPTNLCELFAQAVKKWPELRAVDHVEGCLTYRELDNASSAAAADLEKLGVGRGSVVLLITAHGSFNVVAILSILKLGSCFIPIDRRKWSQDMINYVYEIVESPVVLNTTPEPFVLLSGSCQMLHITSLPQLRVQLSPPCKLQPENNACIIFTSGSTGRPKGVVISHKALCLYATTSPVNMDIAPGDRLLHILSVGFDACICMLFSVLGNGGTLVPSQAEDIYQKASSCTVLAATPSLLSMLPTPSTRRSIFSQIHTIIIGGETASPDLLGSWVDAGVRVLSAYGVTETTAMGCIQKVERDPKSGKVNPFLIGKYMEQSPSRLLDGDSTIIDQENVDGEIVIAGDCLSEGYYKNDTKTKESFVCWNGLRIYRTGDYGRWVRGPAGDLTLEFRGRKDRTVKNSGFLVNLDQDVEDELCKVGLPLGVKSVHATTTANGIVAVITPAAVDTAALLAKAKETMCSYFIPYRVETADSIPLSPNGKVQARGILDIITAVDVTQNHSAATTVLSTSHESQVSAKYTEKDYSKLKLVLQAASEVFGCNFEELKMVRGGESFHEMGGSSLLALKFVLVLRRLGLDISVRDIFKYQKFSSIAQNALPLLSSHYTLAEMGEDATVARNLSDLHRQACNLLGLSEDSFDIGPLTSLQLELSLPTLADESKCVNQVKLVYSNTHASTMERAWRAVWQFEPVFRTEISLAIGCGAQIVHKSPVRQPNSRVYNSRSDYKAAGDGISLAVGLGCTLDFITYGGHTASTNVDPGSISTLSEEDGLIVVLTIHHSLMDGCSLELILGNVERAALGLALASSPSSIDANLAIIAIQQLKDQETKQFFLDYIGDLDPQNSNIARDETDTQRPSQPESQNIKTIVFEATVEKHDTIKFATRIGVSEACIYFTAWAMAISVLEMSPSVVVGGVFSSRGAQLDLENTVGLYVSTLPLVFRFVEDETISDLLQRTMDDLTTVSKYGWARSDQICISPGIGNLVAIQPSLSGGNPRTQPIMAESRENVNFPLNLFVESDGKFRLLYDNSQYTDNKMRRVTENFKHSLHCVLNSTLVRDCMRLNQLQEVVFQRAEHVRIESDDLTVKQALERSMHRFAKEVALEDFNGTKLTYSELDILSNAVALHINASLAGNIIAIYGDGSIQWILGVLGAVKSGRTFVPLDPKWPKDRRAAVCKQSCAHTILLSLKSQEAEAPVIAGLQVLTVESMISGKLDEAEGSRLPDVASADSDLVVVFTSGSLGEPKGIPISNRGLMVYQNNMVASLFASPGRRIAQFMSPAFDCANAEIFGTFLHGATLVLRDPVDPYAQLSMVNTVMATPSGLSAVDIDELPGLDLIISTGEPITSSLVRKFTSRTLFYNAYGPAECTILSSFGRMVAGDRVTIGTPLDTVRMYILDEDKTHVPDGVKGEIYVAGAQVMRGYLNNAAESVERFLLDPWYPDEPMYRTGDYGIRGHDQRVTYLGRIDRVAKVRGCRVELAGVEHAIMSLQGIAQCAAIAVNGTLVAYISVGTAHTDAEAVADIRQSLGEILPSAWVPTVILPIKKFPKNANGKADNKTLEAMYCSSVVANEALLSSSSLSSIRDKLAEQWRQVLQLGSKTSFQDDDDFLRLGGHSILLMLLATRLTASFGFKITVRKLVAAPSFRGHLDVIQHQLMSNGAKNALGLTNEAEDSAPNNHCGPESSLERLTELERQVWFQYQVATTVTTFNIASVLHISGKVDLGRLSDSLNTALSSDPVLCSNMTEGSEGPKRIISASIPMVRQVTQLDVTAEVNYRFDLERDALIRVHLVQDVDNENAHSTLLKLVIVTTHAIADLGTIQNLLRLTSMAYTGGEVTKHETLQHLDSSIWTQRPSLEDRTFWKTYLSAHGYDDGRQSLLRSTFLPSPLATFQGGSRTREFSGRVVTTINKLARRLGITCHQIGLAAAALLLQWLSGEDDIVLGAPNANRSSSADVEALGQFLDRLPVRVTIPKAPNEGDTALNTILVEVRNSSLKALAHAIPFSDILAIHGFPNGQLHHPLFECMVTFHTLGAGLHNWLQLPGCDVSASPQFADGSKFPLMLEWFELGPDRWSLHIEHDPSYIHPGAIGIFENALAIILNAMADERSLSELQIQLGELNVPYSESSEGSPRSSSSYSSPRSSNSCYSLSVDKMAATIQSEMSACLGPTSEVLDTNCSFFAAGADSMAVISLRRRMRNLGIDLSVRAIFVARTPLKLAELVLL